MSKLATNAPNAHAQKLVASYVRAGYVQIDPPILQPAEPFLDLSGEDIRRRLFLTSDPHGRELCLRPDLTIPVSRAYLQSPRAGEAAGFCYLGSVFRHREGAAAEFVQAGIESFARQDKGAADAEMLTLGLEATALYGLTTPQIRIGDVGLFSAFVAALDLAPAWKRRLIKDFNRKSTLAHDLDRLALTAASRPPEYQGVLAALAGSDPNAARHLVADLLSIAGIEAVGGRSVDEIAERFLEQSALGAGTRLPHETRALIERFLSVRADPDEAASELHALATDAAIALDAALDLFETRTGFLAARGVDVQSLEFATAFGRGFDYTPASSSNFMMRGQRARSSPGDAMMACSPGSARPNRSRRSALPPRSKSLRRAQAATGTRHERAAHPRRSRQGPPAAERRGFLRALRARTGQAARRPRLSRRHRRLPGR
jgi:ATP phosphoribosyltransferase regulatory subunit